tara:strand:+ start:1367 stop:2239 length:873 start_codon:yes stop_codon:yes gene_type:complete
MNIEYLNFRGFNTTSQAKEVFLDTGKGEILESTEMYYGIENTRTLTVNKDDVMSIYSYIPEVVNLGGGECENCNMCLSYRVVLGVKNQGYLELNVVSDVPVNNLGGSGEPFITESTAAGIRALTIPFKSWVLNNTNGYNCQLGEGNGANNITTPVEPINGIQYEWTDEAIRAYFGVFNSNIGTVTSVTELISRWLEAKVSDYLVANPGAPITDVVLGEVKDFTYDDGSGPVTYGGFKLRFGGIGVPSPIISSFDESTAVFQKNDTTTYPFRWSDIHAVETSAGGGGEPEA